MAVANFPWVCGGQRGAASDHKMQASGSLPGRTGQSEAPLVEVGVDTRPGVTRTSLPTNINGIPSEKRILGFSRVLRANPCCHKGKEEARPSAKKRKSGPQQ